jgi:hypothetical protein
MGNGFRLPQQQLQQQQARMADGFAHLHGFGEGMAAAMAASSPVKGSKEVQGFNGKVTLRTYRGAEAHPGRWLRRSHRPQLPQQAADPGRLDLGNVHGLNSSGLISPK